MHGPPQATQFQPILASNPMINVYDITKQCEGRLCYGEPALDLSVCARAICKAICAMVWLCLHWQGCVRARVPECVCVCVCACVSVCARAYKAVFTMIRLCAHW